MTVAGHFYRQFGYSKKIAVKALLVTLSLAFAFTPGLSAQAERQKAKHVAKEFLTSVESEGITATSRYMHPKAMQQFKGLILPIYEQEHKAGKMSLLRKSFGKEMTIEKLRNMDSAEIFEKIMQQVSIGVAVSSAMLTQFINASQKDKTGQPAENAAKIGLDKFEILGTIKESRKIRHVITRLHIKIGPDLTVILDQHFSFKRHKKTWRLLLGSKIESYISLFNQMVTESQRKAEEKMKRKQYIKNRLKKKKTE